METQPTPRFGPYVRVSPRAATRPPVAARPAPRPRPRASLVAGLLALLVGISLLVAACGGEVGYAPTPRLDQQPSQLAPQSETGAQFADVSGDGTAQTPPGWDRKIIRNGAINLTVVSVEDSLAAVRAIAAQAEGLVFSSNTQFEGEEQVATITIQVPAATFDDVMGRLRKLGVKVVSETSTSQDVTEEYTDLTSQLKNLQAQEEQLRLLMGRATTVDETLTVQRELGTVRGEIEKIQGRMNYLSRRAELSSIVVTLAPRALVATPAGWQPAGTAERAWNASLATLARLADVVITVVVFSWWLIPFLLLGVWMLRGRLRARRGPQPTG